MAKNVPPAPAEKEPAEGSRETIDQALKNQDRKGGKGGSGSKSGGSGKKG
jgi:hypothetical protein